MSSSLLDYPSVPARHVFDNIKFEEKYTCPKCNSRNVEKLRETLYQCKKCNRGFDV